MKTYLAILGWLLMSAMPAYGQNIFVVNSVLDHNDAIIGDGQCLTTVETCTLRAAIQEANATGNALAGPDEIHFSTSLPTPVVIREVGQLTGTLMPHITDDVVIDGTTGAGSHVIIDQDDPTIRVFSLEGGSGGSTIRGLVIGDCSVAIRLESDENLIENNLIGISPAGIDVGCDTGIEINSGSGNRIRENIIALNDKGILVNAGINNIISKNLIGVDASGNVQPNGDGLVDHGTQSLIGGTVPEEGNVFGYASRIDLQLLGEAALVRHNLIGVGPGGEQLGSSVGAGIRIESNNNVLLDNIIGFQQTMIHLHGERNTLKRNFIGTNADGDDLGLSNPGLVNIGLHLSGAGETIIGGSRADGNTIGFIRGDGLRLDDSANTLVQGNYIGADAAGNRFGNDGNGILLSGAAFQNTIGYGALDTLDTTFRFANVIAYNSRNGIAYTDAAGAHNTSMRGNRLHENGLMGIDLGIDGPTPNDIGDADEGANFLQNYPVISESGYDRSRDAISVVYSIDADNTEVTYPLVVDVYIADGKNSGEGKIHLGAHIYAISGATERFDIPAAGLDWEETDVLVLTATDPFGNTSEFSEVSSEIGPRISPVSIEDENEADYLERGYALSAAYPNPFNPQTSFALQVVKQQHVRITVHDVLGRTIAVIHDAEIVAGTKYTFAFDAASYASGTYLLRVQGTHFLETQQLVLLK